MNVVFVSAIYDIGDKLRGATYPATLWENAKRLSRHLPGGLHICCSSEDVTKQKGESSDDTITLYPYEMDVSSSQTVRELIQTTRLPPSRNVAKDTLPYLILQNMKPEFLQHVKQQRQQNGHTTDGVYVWIDAGILKIVSPSQQPSLLERLQTPSLYRPVDSHAIRIPGPGWSLPTNIQQLTQQIWWRFCGGIVICPAELVDVFATEHLRACCEIREQSVGCATWEVNVWTYMDVHNRVPIELVPGDHNVSIFNCLFKETET